MLSLRRSQDRGHAEHGWLESYHSFSFADYYDPEYMGYSALRVINEDRVVPAAGFPTHPHRDMEIVTYMLDGALVHRDSMGNGSVIRPGEVQRMSAGTGVTHSEYNASDTEQAHFLQIWILPQERGLTPSYEQKQFPEQERRDSLRLVASADGAEGSVTVHQDVRLYAGLLKAGSTLRQPLTAGRHGYLHVARGAVSVNTQPLTAGDAAMIEQEAELVLSATHDAEVLFFDLP